tara:strand:- start:1798 stop:2013 length:216 start_codon:yes stop_codon:yes gene_type:complete
MILFLNKKKSLFLIISISVNSAIKENIKSDKNGPVIAKIGKSGYSKKIVVMTLLLEYSELFIRLNIFKNDI